MKNRLVSLCSLLSLVALLGACQKAEQPAPDGADPSAAAQSETVALPAIRAATSTPAAPSEGVLLQVKWPVGQRYVYRMDLDQHSTNHIPQMPRPMEQQTAMAMTYALSVLKETPEGGNELELEFLANEMEMKMAEQVVISFDSKESGDDTQPFSAPLRKMIGTKVRLQTDAKGRVEQVLNLDEWRRSLTGDQPGPMGGMIAQQFNEEFFRQVADFGRGLPEAPVQVGQSWPQPLSLPAGPLGKIDLDALFTFKGWEERQDRKTAALLVTGTFQGATALPDGPKMSIESGQLAGKSWFDPELGRLVESLADQTMLIKGEMPGGQGGITIEIGQKVSLALVEAGKVNP